MGNHRGTVHRIVLTRFDFNRMDTHCCVVVNQIVNLTLLAVVVIKEFVARTSDSPRFMMKSSYTPWFSTLFNNYFRPKIHFSIKFYAVKQKSANDIYNMNICYFNYFRQELFVNH